MVFGGDRAQEAGGWTRAAVAARLPKHQDELNVTLDDLIRLVGLPRYDPFPFETSVFKLLILCQMIGARLSKPISVQ